MKEEYVFPGSQLVLHFVTTDSTSLHLHGNQLNYITTSWTVGYIIGQIPSKLALCWTLFALSYSIQYAYYARPTVDMGKLVIARIHVLEWLTSTPFLDSYDGVNMGFPHYVPCCEHELFDPLCGTLLYRVGRVDLFPCHPGVFMV